MKVLCTERPVQERREARRQEPAKGLGPREQLVGQLHGQEPGLRTGGISLCLAAGGMGIE